MIRSIKYTVSEKTRSVLRVPNLDDDDFKDATYAPFKRQVNRTLQPKQPPGTNSKQFRARKPDKTLFSKLLIDLVTKLVTTEF